MPAEHSHSPYSISATSFLFLPKHSHSPSLSPTFFRSLNACPNTVTALTECVPDEFLCLNACQSHSQLVYPKRFSFLCPTQSQPLVSAFLTVAESGGYPRLQLMRACLKVTSYLHTHTYTHTHFNRYTAPARHGHGSAR